MAEIKAYISVPLPYEFESVDNLKLDSEVDRHADLKEMMQHFLDTLDPPHYTDPEEALEIMFRSVVCLKTHNPDLSLASCLSTAIVWYFG